MPPATLDAYRDHGRPATRIKDGVNAAEDILSKLKAQGIDLAEITRQLETDGVRLFSDSYKKILKDIEAKK